MTAKQALTEARRRWGKQGNISMARATWQDPRTKEWKSTQQRYRVGRIMFDMFFEIKGMGDNWADAFSNATNRQEMSRLPHSPSV